MRQCDIRALLNCHLNGEAFEFKARSTIASSVDLTKHDCSSCSFVWYTGMRAALQD